MLNYSQTVDWMFQQLPMFQRVGTTAFKKDLTNIILLSEHLKNPERKFKSIHVGGTNGKGSTSHMLASIFQEAGYKVGLYTSPHLKDYRERIKINGKEIPEEKVVHFISENMEFLEKNQLSFFEMSVGMAFNYFAEEKVDIAIIEVGLGGRLDSTNIITPELSVITNIGLDHTAMLGETLEVIAGEKAGIIKKNIPIVIGENQPETKPVFKQKAASLNAKIIFAEDELQTDLTSDLKGSYQQRNIQTVVTAIRILISTGWKISSKYVENGLLNVILNTGLRGRWDVLKDSPKVICDTAHNAEGLTYVMKQLKLEPYKKLHIVLGVVNDKDLNKVLPLFPKNAIYYFCRPNIPRGLDAHLLQKSANLCELTGQVYSSVNVAYATALESADASDVIFVGGSTFVVAEVL